MNLPTSDAGSRCLLTDTAVHWPVSDLVLHQPRTTRRHMDVRRWEAGLLEDERDEAGRVAVRVRVERRLVVAFPVADQ